MGLNYRIISHGLALLYVAGFMYGLSYLYRDLYMLNYIQYTSSLAIILAILGSILIIYAILYPEPIWFIVTGEEDADTAFNYRKSLGITYAESTIRIVEGVNENLLREIMNYYTNVRGYKYVGLTDYIYVFKRRAAGFRGLWSRNITLKIYFEEKDDGSSIIHLDYEIGLLLNPLIRGETLESYVEAEVLALYRYLRTRWSKIYGEPVAEKNAYDMKEPNSVEV